MGGAVLMITITDRSRCGEFAAWYQEQGIPLVLTALGSGTATTEILDCLGLEATEKAVLFCVAPHSPQLVRRAEKELIFILTLEETRVPIMKAIMAQAGMQTEAQSLVFSLPVSDIAGLRRLDGEN